MNKIILFLLIIIILFGALIRLYDLGKVPGSLNWDEVSWGYNAYSIFKTGMDEHGNRLPLSFKAFGDYKQPVYVYLTAPFVGLFSLEPFFVRLPSALSGILGICFVYLLVVELFSYHRHRKYIALLSAGLLAISPWSIQFSRLAYEANVALMFVIFGSWLFVRGINKKSIISLFISIIPLSISAYTYHSEKVVVPLLFIGLLVFGYSYLKTSKKVFYTLIIAFILCNIPWIIDVRTTARGRSVTIFSQQTALLDQSINRLATDRNNADYFSLGLHNRRIEYAKIYLNNYLKHFDPNYLFLKGFDVRHHAPGMGLLYILSFPFIIIGFIYLIKHFNRSVGLMFYWLILGPLASAIAINAPNESRSLMMLPIWQIVEAFGIYVTILYIKNKPSFLPVLICIIMLYFSNIVYYMHQYFVHINTDDLHYWQFGYKEAVEYINKNDFDRVIFDDSIEQGYIFYLFYTKYDPDRYIQQGGMSKRTECFQIENVYFSTTCINTIQRDDVLVTSDENIPEGFKTIHKIPYNGMPYVITIARYDL